MRGRKPIPTELKIIRGNPGRRPLPKDEPVPPDGEARCPSWLKGRARDFWIEHETYLTAMGLLTVVDVPMLAQLCDVEAEYWNAADDVEKHGISIRRKRYDKHGRGHFVHLDNPSVKIRSDAGKRLARLEVEFGMSPSSRTRVKAAPKPAEKSALEKLRERRQA